MLKAAIFDIDDTLYDFVGSHAHALEETEKLAVRELGVDRDLFHETYRKAMKWQFDNHSDASGCHSRAIRFQRALEALHLPLKYASVFNDYYWNSLIDVVTPFEGTVELFDWLHSRNVLLGVGTDMTADWQIKKLTKLGLIDKLDFVITSEEAAAEKPSPEFFQLCLEKGKCKPAESIFVGDNIVKDAQGALKMGMGGIWFQPDGAKRAEHPDVPSVANMGELLAKLQKEV